jgi:hypothetical protein
MPTFAANKDPKMKKQIIAAAILLSAAGAKAQDIATVRNAPVGSTVTVRGVALNGPELANIRYIQDATGGVAIYGFNLTAITEGDSIVATGTMTNYNNLAEITPVSTFTILDSVGIPAPQLITDPSTISDMHESELLRFENCTFAAGGGTFAGNTNYNVTSNGETFQVRIMNGNPLVGQIIPVGFVNLTGIMSQYCFDPETGCTTGYQLLLRTADDIQSTSSIFLTQPISTSAITTAGFNIHWSTNVAGTNSYVRYGLTPALEGGTVTANNAAAHTATLTGLQPGTIYYVRAYSWNNADSAVTLERTFATQSLSSGDIRVYFNRHADTDFSDGTDAQWLDHLVADTLAAYIDRVQQSLDVCIYNWDNSFYGDKITDAINDAHARGVKVRIISDGSTMNTGVNDLNGQIPVLSTPQGADYTIMHNKFVIMDANVSNPDLPVVWTGSTNFTAGQLVDDPNNVIIFQDQSLARGYKLEFDEMWGDTVQDSDPNMTESRFGQFKTDNTPHEYVIGGKRVESYFSPSDQTNTQILKTIATADDDMYFGVMVITRTDLAYAMRDRIQQQSLEAKGMVDIQANSSTPYSILSPVMGANLAENGHNWIFHHKYLIVDESNTASDPIVLTGSHNWSNAADQKNDENTVIVHDASVANQYYQEFMGRWCERNGGNCLLGIGENSGQTIVIYPNPSSGSFTVSGSGAIANVRVTDITGKEMQATVTNGDNETSVEIDSAAQGIYLVNYTVNGQPMAQQIVIR